ncbi:hypothetical protein ACFEA2_005313 [Escherichia coli]
MSDSNSSMHEEKDDG